MNPRIIGGIIIVIIVGIAIYFSKDQIIGKPAVTLKGFVGGEKLDFLSNESVKKILKKKYGIILDYTKAGSIDMVENEPPKDIDFLWPSNQIAVDIFREKYPSLLLKSQVIFNSPIVLYSWDIVTDALIKENIVTLKDGIYYVVDFPKLIDYVIQEKKWKDIGLDDLFGKMTIIPTDPTKSNSGNMFAGLLVNIMNSDVVDETSVNKYLPRIKIFFDRLGFMEQSSSDLFYKYLTQGLGAYPIITNYENLMIEFSQQNPKVWLNLKKRVRVLYPEPTIWSSHPVIVVNKKANILIDALQDKEVLKIAWEKHGFRSGPENDPKVFDLLGIPKTITKVVNMPKYQVMDKIINTLQGSK
jgi:hypothetical protein